ncbi:MAG: GIY-YIG nuclease family protein [Candidatus Pacebacteria bacterium]|nr:GIY-YIG nuclease family protein [Candidatus Paceibacterota bacterium]
MTEEKKNWFIYIIKCNDNTLYTGITNDLDKRIDKHNTGTGAKYTRNRTPVKLVYSEPSSDRSSASKREAQIKGLSRLKKLELIK